MKRQTDSTAESLIRSMEQAARSPKTWDAWLAEHDQPARLEFPFGEVFNEAIAGFCWAWQLKGMLKPKPILESDQFTAQGLEGKVVVETELVTALLAFRDLPKYRRQIAF